MQGSSVDCFVSDEKACLSVEAAMTLLLSLMVVSLMMHMIRDHVKLDPVSFSCPLSESVVGQFELAPVKVVSAKSKFVKIDIGC